MDEEGGQDSLSLDQSLFYLQQILQGVYHLHSNDILHLDIKGAYMYMYMYMHAYMVLIL